MRSEPEAWSARVMIARPFAFSTAATTASESVATTVSPIFAACARRSTCTIIGSPAISAKGLPGRRLEAIRAGMRMMLIIGLATGVCEPDLNEFRVDRGAYTGCQTGGKTVSVRRCQALGGNSGPSRLAPFSGAFFDEFLRTQQGVGRHSWHLPDHAGPQYHCRCYFFPPETGQARLRNRGQGKGQRRKRRAQGAGAADRESAGFGVGRKGPGDRQAVPGLPHLREGRPQPCRA